ncbi:MAG TPA: low temperature requirement protein A [Candidatus Limnocylindrales bacterium]|nr:low temperature requirement protein A [Candidatus Limnocylindrales bacterium]
MEHRVSPVELYFDLVMVFAFTQITGLLADDPTWMGLIRGFLVFATLWGAWEVYSWFTSAIPVERGAMRVAMLAATGTLVVVALAVPDALEDDALLFGVAYFAVRLLHLVLLAIAARGDPDRRGAVARFAPTAILASSLYVIAAFVAPDMRMVLWAVALAISYVGPVLIGVGASGWQVGVEHFAERQGLIVLIALGESILAIGAGAGRDLDPPVILGVALSMVIAATFWWLYFGTSADLGLRRLAREMGIDRVRYARNAYGFLHLPVVAAIVLYAFGVESALHHVDQPMELVPAATLGGGVSLYLIATVVFIRLAARRLAWMLLIGSIATVVVVPLAGTIPALATLAFVAAVGTLATILEALRPANRAEEASEAR